MKLSRTLVLLVVAALASGVGCKEKTEAAPGGSGSAAKPAAVTLTPPTTPIKAGQPFAVAWTGPNGPSDYVDVVASGRPKQVGDELAYVKTSAGNPAKLNAPGEPGTYDVRYVQDHGDRTVIAHVSITVVK